MEDKGLTNDASFEWLFPNASLGNNEADKQELLLNSGDMTFCEGEAIVRQGSFISQIIYLKSGIVKVVLESENNKSSIVKIIEGSQLMALPALGSSGQYSFSIITLTNCDVRLIRKDVFYNVVQRNTSAFDFVMQWFSDDYRYIYNKISVTNTRNSHGKVAHTLLYLTRADFKGDVLNTVSRKDIAEMSGTSKESVNKIMQQLNHDGLISIKQDVVSVRRRDLLEKLSTIG